MQESFNCACGKKIRSRRLSLGLTQTKLGDSVGVTFQ